MEISWNGSALYYTKTGSGNRVIIFFHGFGQDHSVFAGLMDALGGEFTSYSVDLFFHGKSDWAHGERPISLEEAKTFFEKFLNQEGIQRFSILGYSIGCRFALACLSARPSRVDNLVMVAPDGLVSNPWYSMATGTAPMRALFRYTIRHPRLFHHTVYLVRLMKLANPKALRFSEAMMRDPQKREKVFRSWVVFRRLGMPLTTLQDMLCNNSIECTIILAKKDTIAVPSVLEKRIAHMKEIEMQYVEGGHHRMLDHLPALVKRILYNAK